MDEKLRIAHHPGPDPQRGFSSVGSENSSKLYREGLLGNQLAEELSDARVSRYQNYGDTLVLTSGLKATL